MIRRAGWIESLLLNRIQQIRHGSRKAAKESRVASPYTSTMLGRMRDNGRQNHTAEEKYTMASKTIRFAHLRVFIVDALGSLRVGSDISLRIFREGENVDLTYT